MLLSVERRHQAARRCYTLDNVLISAVSSGSTPAKCLVTLMKQPSKMSGKRKVAAKESKINNKKNAQLQKINKNQTNAKMSPQDHIKLH